MPRKWIFIEFVSGDPWVLPIWTAYGNAESRERIPAAGHALKELGLQISTRLNLLPRVVARLNASVQRLFEIARQDHTPDHLSTEECEGFALRVPFDLLYDLLIDVDSFLFELSSACELIEKFAGMMWEKMGEVPRDSAGREIQRILSAAGQDTGWFVDLSNARNFFIHEGAPFVAVDPSGAQYDLLVMRENLRSFRDSTKYRRLSQLNQMAAGFQEAKSIIQQHFIRKLDSLG